MAPLLHSLQTVVPPTVLVQDEVREVFAAQPGLNRLAQRIVSTSFRLSGIERRHTVIAELTLERASEDPVFFDAHSGELLLPGTKTRNDLYTDALPGLILEAAGRALESAEGVEIGDVTHVITVSCTGFYAPGPDFQLARDLGLPADVQRYHLGFMGCYASMPALRAAAQFCAADPDAVVLVVSAELCTLHVRSSNDPDTIVASSLFSDGVAAGIVSNRAPTGAPAFRLDAFETVVTPVGEEAMAWTIGDRGFEMVLSSYVPHIIGDHIEGALGPLFSGEEQLRTALADGDASARVDHWAIHPGGRDILDRVQERLGLSEVQLEPSRETLRDYGNMSSATVLFVLKNILEREGVSDGDRVAAMAFGPGLTVESALFTVSGG